MQLLKLAPLSESLDMFIALGFCYLPVLVWFYFGWRASKSGSYVKKQREGFPFGHYEWVKSDENVPFTKTAQFKIGMLWLFFGSLFFWALLWPDHSDVWFVK
jgi:hypothetical protein